MYGTSKCKGILCKKNVVKKEIIRQHWELFGNFGLLLGFWLGFFLGLVTTEFD